MASWSERLFEQAVAQAKKAKSTTRKDTLKIALGTNYDRRAKSIKMSTLERDINAMQREANRRYKALAKRSMAGTAMQRYEKELQKEYDTAGKTQQQLINRAKKLQYFLGLKTSTVKGYRAAVAHEENFLGKIDRLKLSESEKKSFWDAWDKMKANRSLKVWKVGSDVIIGQIAKIVKEDKRLKRASTIASRLTKSYAQAEAEKEVKLWKKDALVRLS